MPATHSICECSGNLVKDVFLDDTSEQVATVEAEKPSQASSSTSLVDENTTTTKHEDIKVTIDLNPISEILEQIRDFGLAQANSSMPSNGT